MYRCRSWLFILTLSVGLFLTQEAFGAKRLKRRTRVENEAGTEIYSNIKENKVTNHRLFVAQKINKTYEYVGTFSILASYRARVDTQKDFVTTNTPYSVDVQELAGDWAVDIFNIKAGLSTVTWGETLGFPITDIVNPRDLTEPPFADDTQAKLPVGMVNLQLLPGSFRAEILAVPLPRKVPAPTNPNLLLQRRKYSAGEDTEFGGRLGYLFDFGLDVSALYFDHWNRAPTYSLNRLPTGTLFLREEDNRVQSMGGSFSLALGDFVMRGDSIFHQNYAVNSVLFEPPEKRNLTQSAVSIDYTFEDFSLLAQYQDDRYDYIPPLLNKRFFNWAGGRIRYALITDILDAEVMSFHGLNNPDTWTKVAFTINMGTRNKINLEGHLSYGKPQEGYFKENELINAKYTLQF